MRQSDIEKALFEQCKNSKLEERKKFLLIEIYCKMDGRCQKKDLVKKGHMHCQRIENLRDLDWTWSRLDSAEILLPNSVRDKS